MFHLDFASKFSSDETAPQTGRRRRTLLQVVRYTTVQIDTQITSSSTKTDRYVDDVGDAGDVGSIWLRGFLCQCQRSSERASERAMSCQRHKP